MPEPRAQQRAGTEKLLLTLRLDLDALLFHSLLNFEVQPFEATRFSSETLQKRRRCSGSSPGPTRDRDRDRALPRLPSEVTRLS